MVSRGRLLQALRVGLPLLILMVSHALPVLAALPRTARDRKDSRDQKGRPQIHVIYAVPRDGEDRALDTNGTIDRSVEAIRRWFREQSEGRDLRFDSLGANLDISFARLTRTDAEISARGPFVRDELESLLRAKGFNKPGKIYLVFYDGHSTYACGGGAWPPVLKGSYAALYLRGEVPGYTPCEDNPFAADEDSPGYWEYSLIHEIFHTLGFVASCAPNFVLSGHVGDSNQDLMYAGSQPWYPSLLDFNCDDYFADPKPDCLDLIDSAFLLPPPAAGSTIPKRTRWPAVTGPPPCGAEWPGKEPAEGSVAGGGR